MFGKWACLYSLIALWVPVSNGNLLAQNTVQLDKGELIEVEALTFRYATVGVGSSIKWMSQSAWEESRESTP